MTVHTVLRTDEAVELAHAWVQHEAERHGIRVLLIKGPALHRQGLREPRDSADVDALVDPARFEDFCRAVTDAGWRERTVTLLGGLTTLHSRTYIRDGWPCDLDVHGFFPGFLADPAEVFETLWRRRTTLAFAHRPLVVPDRVAHALVLALHSVRGTREQARHVLELEQLLQRAFTDDERDQLAALADETGCRETLAEVLPGLGVEASSSAPASTATLDPALREWRVRAAAGSSPTYKWTLALRLSPWRQRPRILWRAIWPTRAELLAGHPETPDRPGARLQARLRRFGRGARALRHIARAFWQNRSDR